MKVIQIAAVAAAESAADEWDDLVQPDRVHRSLYTDPAIFAREMDHVYAATWVYLAHESEIPEPNDFRQAWLGTREVIVTRDEEGQVRVFSNRCSHRGATVCREHKGNATNFTCPYHGWRFDNRGQLFGIPGKNAYGPAFKARDMHLARPAQVSSYKGFIFATLNPEAPPLAEHLGVLPQHFANWDLGAKFTARHVRKLLPANWKACLEAFLESYHVLETHPQGVLTVGDANSQYDIYGE